MNDQTPKLISYTPELRLPEHASADSAQTNVEVVTAPGVVETGIGQSAVELTQQPELIDSIPGSEGSSTYRDPSDAVAEINAQLASRPAGAGMPEIRAGGEDGLVTQKGSLGQ